MGALSLFQKLFAANPDAVVLADMPAAFIGLGRSAENTVIAVYSKRKILAELRQRGLSGDDMDEYYLAQFANFRAGPHAPVILDDTE
jgi:hypothetical protein